ncbi:substrate-binding periplasmic protein [Treponema parvum]|uniref:substrate-binding periplasmic protein n=1 Tax=Treponema parvum TaxID=138851 RepID=UPI001AEC4117|nr:ABC transporter substrate-binding protein [Treponema parvum]QTQ15535.1 amino acid ABC transporter substrate-binding protein [Treponema parvum]
MKKILLFIVGSSILFFASCAKKSETSMVLKSGELQIGVNVAYPPFEYYGEDGKTAMGFDIDLGNAVAKKLGLKAKFIDVAWEGIFAGLNTNKYDCIISGVTITPERLEAFEFSKPYVGNGQSIIIRKDSDLKISAPEDLTGLTVGYLTESTSDIFMTAKAEAGLKFTAAEYDDAMNSFADLKNGRCDAVVSDSLVAVDYVSKPNNPYKIAWQGKAEEFLGIAMKKGNKELAAAVDKALLQLRADGTLKKLSEKNFGSDIVSDLN